jgi:hypothetical protein
MQYILNEEEMSNLVQRTELKEMTNNFEIALKAYQESGKCVPHWGCHECPLCSINIKRPKICDKQSLGK